MAAHQRTHPIIFGVFFVVIWLVESPVLRAADKAPVPPVEAQNAALALVKDVYGDEYDETKSSEQKTALTPPLPHWRN